MRSPRPRGRETPRALDRTRLRVSARRDGRVIQVAEFVEGDHFQFHAGRIELSVAVDGANDNIVGLALVKTTLGVDQRGDGKMRETVAGAGIALLIPFALAGQEHVRFRRVGD